MDVNDGRFMMNGGCGYVLKPKFMRDKVMTSYKRVLMTSYHDDIYSYHILVNVESSRHLYQNVFS